MNETEHKALRKIIRQEEKFQKNKKIGVFALVLWIGIFFALASVFTNATEHFGYSQESFALYTSIIYPLLLATGISVTLQASHLYRNWNGNPERKLIISLCKRLDEQTNEGQNQSERDNA